MDNNKNRMKDRPKSNPELRKMYSEHGADIGIENGQKIEIVAQTKLKLKNFIIKLKKEINT